MSSGCLITDPPQFKLPAHTRPLLDATTANRDPSDVVVIDETNAHTPVTFSVDVISQEDVSENSEFHKLQARFFIDYGAPADLKPYLYLGPTQITSSPDGKRRVTAQWFPDAQPVGSGCHRATLFVMHAVDSFTQCPLCADDYSTLTWKILRCDRSKGECDNLVLNGLGECPELTNTCPTLRARLADAGIEVDSCPEADTDGGSP